MLAFKFRTSCTVRSLVFLTSTGDSPNSGCIHTFVTGGMAMLSMSSTADVATSLDTELKCCSIDMYDGGNSSHMLPEAA